LARLEIYDQNAARMKTTGKSKDSEDGRFGAKFRACRQRCGLTLAQLAKKATALGCLGVSASSLFNLETGAKRPSREKLGGLILAMGLSPDEAQSLLRSAGYRVIPESFIERTQAAVERATNGASDADAELLVSQIEAFSDRFRLSLAARADDVRVAIVPVAGWQARALVPEIVERSLEPALHEIMRAGIKEVVLVTAPGADSHWRLKASFGKLHIRVVEQEQPSGLGHALLRGRPLNHLGPVAVLLPDEVDPTGEALGRRSRPGAPPTRQGPVGKTKAEGRRPRAWAKDRGKIYTHR
jgi:transcriptional regulator with XRE-family HTH domain